jgi:hypothetical protein
MISTTTLLLASLVLSAAFPCFAAPTQCVTQPFHKNLVLTAMNRFTRPEAKAIRRLASDQGLPVEVRASPDVPAPLEARELRRLVRRRVRRDDNTVPSLARNIPVDRAKDLSGRAKEIIIVTSVTTISESGEHGKELLDADGNGYRTVTYVEHHRHGKHRHGKHCPMSQPWRKGSCQCKHKCSGEMSGGWKGWKSPDGQCKAAPPGGKNSEKPTPIPTTPTPTTTPGSPTPTDSNDIPTDPTPTLGDSLPNLPKLDESPLPSVSLGDGSNSTSTSETASPTPLPDSPTPDPAGNTSEPPTSNNNTFDDTY